MKEDYKKYQHNPPHLFIPNAKYFVTSSTLGKYPYLRSDDAKWATLHYLKKSLEYFNWELEDWVILDNHIHIMINAPEDSTTLSQLFKNFHRFTANWLSKHNIRKVREKYFHNFWDTCITYENSYFSRLHYIWYNPVKHNYVDSPEKWEFGSYYFRYKEEMKEMNKIIESYPIYRLKIEDDF